MRQRVKRIYPDGPIVTAHRDKRGTATESKPASVCISYSY